MLSIWHVPIPRNTHKHSHVFIVSIIKTWWPISKSLLNPTSFELNISCKWTLSGKDVCNEVISSHLWSNHPLVPFVVSTTSAARSLTFILSSTALYYQLTIYPTPWRIYATNACLCSHLFSLLHLHLLGSRVRRTGILTREISVGGYLLAAWMPPRRISHCVLKRASLAFQDLLVVGSATSLTCLLATPRL